MTGTKPLSFPMEQNHKFALDDSDHLDNPRAYHRLIGRLIFFTITRSELCYSVHILSQFMHQPHHGNWVAALRVLRYHKSSPGKGIFLSSKADLSLRAYCDSDWASCPLTRRSITGYFILLGDSPISWKTKKQTTVSRSSAEVEYRSMGLRTLLKDLTVNHSFPAQLLCNNRAALHIAANPVHHERTKHIEIDCHFIRDCIQSCSIMTSHVSSNLQLADIFTKALGNIQFQFLVGKLGIRNLRAPT
ncbi:UNVERIFIED_CONTAM: Retrovirus-related Pol polyprotein from transposon RE2 [Sesamum latifolium]|uniref:Retrovirus-related Pol polyprotein from transposon RE2 n=1 Tax=Sesamum latifolium TaxID=2727402 RepID=A0AAW2U402_9LAMI